LVCQLKCFQELKCIDYQLAVQALAVESKLHKLYDETRHEGKNEMDFEVQPTYPAVVAISSSTSVSLAGDTEVGCSSDMSISSDESNGSIFRGIDTEARNNGAAGYVAVADDGDSNWEDDEFMLDVRGVDCKVETMSDRGEDCLGGDEDDNINMEAYDRDVGGNGVQKTEQAGVIHLVHGWTQRGHPNEVSRLFVF
jgi:hypothetical protein